MSHKGFRCAKFELVISDVRSGKLNFKNTRHVPVEYFKTLSPERIPLKGDILFTVTGSYGIPVLINVDMEFCFQRHIALLKPMIDYTFLSYILESPFIKTQCDAVATGTAQKTVGLKSLKSLLLPLPPLYEQGRIITKIEELQPDIDAYDKAQTKLQAIEQRFPDDMKKSLLQYAIEGKLVPQRKEEGTAKDLLAEIRAEKARLIKEKKIKKSKPLPAITDNERPFNIPASWEWVHLEDVGYFISGYTPKKENLCDKVGIPYFKVSDMNTLGNECWLRYTSIYWNNEYGNPKAYEKGTIVYPQNGGAIFTNKKRILAQDSIVDLNTGGYKPFDGFLLSFAYHIFLTIDFKQYNKGTALPTLDMNKIKNILIPMPLLAEQHRIVAKLEELLPLCQQLDSHP